MKTRTTTIVSLLGDGELQQKLKDMVTAVTGPDGAAVMRTAGLRVRDSVRRRTPRGKHVNYSRIRFEGRNHQREGQKYGMGSSTWERGRLRDAVISYAGVSKRGKHVYSWVKVNYSAKYGPTAPHGHFVEFGTRDRRAKNSKYMKFPSRRGRWVYAQKVADVAPRPYFKPGVESASGAALTSARDKFDRIMQRIASRGY